MLHTKKLYNIMALALSRIEACTNDHDLERMRNLSDDHLKELMEGLKRRFPDLFNKVTGDVAEIFELQLWESSLVEELELYVQESDHKEELIFLVKTLDSFLEDTVYSCVPADEEQYWFQSLNDNYNVCKICLLPRLKCGWEHKNRNAYTSYSMDYYMRNFYYLHEADLKGYRMQHILMPRELFRRAVRRGEIRVMVSPVSAREIVKVTEPYIKNNVRYVSVDPISDEEEKYLQVNLDRILKMGIEDKADILLLPEMLGTEQIVEELGQLESAYDEGMPCLTICPSIWRQHHNYCSILDDTGERVCEQHKHHGVDLTRWSAKEDIESDQTIYVLHCNGIGRIAVAICKDFLITKYLRILVEKLKVNLLLVPSFTKQDYQFEALSSKYIDLDCNVIWVNACAARWLEETGEMQASVTMACLPGRHGVTRLKRGINDLCQGNYECNGTCRFIYRIKGNEVDR